MGYLNVGNKYEPRYTFFNMNRNIEYFSLPEKSKTENIKYNLDFQKFCDEYFNYHTEDIRIKAEKEKKYKELVEKEKEEEEKRAKENAEREKKGEKPKKYDNIKDKIKKEGILELTEEEKNLLKELESKIPEIKIEEIFKIRKKEKKRKT